MPHLPDAFEGDEAAPGALDFQGGHVRLHHGLELDQSSPGGGRLLPDLLHEVEAQPALARSLVNLNERHRLVPRHGHVVRAQLVAGIAFQAGEHPLDELLAFQQHGLLRQCHRFRSDFVPVREEGQRRIDLLGREFEVDERRSDEGRFIEIESGQLVFQLDNATKHGPDHGGYVAPLLYVEHVVVAQVELAAHHDVAQVDEAQSAEQDVPVFLGQGGGNLLLLLPQSFQLVLRPSPQLVKVASSDNNPNTEN